MIPQERIRWLVLVLLLEFSLFVTLLSAHFLSSIAAPVVSENPFVPIGPLRSVVVLEKFSFESQESLKRWEEKTFKGQTNYQVLQRDHQSFLQTSSNDSSSGLYKKVNYRVTPDLYLSWKWKPVVFPRKREPNRLSNKAEDDFAARIYLIFLGSNFFRSDVIEYVWDEKISTGTTVASPYSERVKLFVVRSGAPSEENGGWREEERNIYEDYWQLFKKEPARPLGVIALMSDSDNTGTRSEADFGEIILKTKHLVPGITKKGI